MDKFIIKSARRQDYKSIRSLIRDVRINPFGLNWKNFLIAVDQTGEMVGCGQIKVHQDLSRELASIAVKKAFRYQGIARSIISELVRQESTRPLYLTCKASLEQFYRQFGFETINSNDMPRYFRFISWLAGFIPKGLDPSRRLIVMRLD